MTMSNEYRVEAAGGAFIVIDPWGERLVDVFPTEDAARQDIERCKKEDAMYETAKQLVDTAVKAHMEMFGVDRETVSYWVIPDLRSGRCPMRKRVLLEGAFAFVLIFTLHELCRREVGRAP